MMLQLDNHLAFKPMTVFHAMIERKLEVTVSRSEDASGTHAPTDGRTGRKHHASGGPMPIELVAEA